MLYKNSSIKELDSKYGIKVDMHRVYPEWIKNSCIIIQRVFARHNIYLTLYECRDLYETYSEEIHNTTWSFTIEEESDEEIFKKLFSFIQTILSDRGRRVLQLGREVHNCKYYIQGKQHDKSKTNS